MRGADRTGRRQRIRVAHFLFCSDGRLDGRKHEPQTFQTQAALLTHPEPPSLPETRRRRPTRLLAGCRPTTVAAQALRRNDQQPGSVFYLPAPAGVPGVGLRGEKVLCRALRRDHGAAPQDFHTRASEGPPSPGRSRGRAVYVTGAGRMHRPAHVCISAVNSDSFDFKDFIKTHRFQPF